MREAIRFEIDTLPSVFLSGREFTGNLIERQLHRPLFRAQGHRAIPDLLETQDTSEHQWVFRVARDATWEAGEPVHAIEIARRLRDTCRTPAGSWLSSLIERVEAIGAEIVRVTTRQHVSVMDKVLTDPAFAPRRTGCSTGAYRVVRRGRRRVTLQPTGSAVHPVELVSTISRAEGRRMFAAGLLDVGWGIGVPPEFFTQDDAGPFVADSPIDMHVVVVAGRDIPVPLAFTVLESLQLGEGAPLGVEPTSSRFAVVPPMPQPRGPSPEIRPMPLYYTDFPPNRDIASHLAASSRVRLVPTPVSYDRLVSGSQPRDGFSVQVHASRFPDPAGLYVESALVAQGWLRAPPVLRELSHDVWASDSRAVRLGRCRAVEEPLDRLLARRVVGRMRTRFRSHHHIELPPTGWLDFTHLRKGGRHT